MSGQAPSSPTTHTDQSVLAIVGGTTIPDRAAIVRRYCREGSHVELRRDPGTSGAPAVSVWLKCGTTLGLIPSWKKIGYLPPDAALSLEPLPSESRGVVAHGKVQTVYAPTGRDEAAVAVKIDRTLNSA